MFANFNDDIWDEHQWEAHLNEIAKQNTQLRKFIAPDASDSTPRWLILLRENRDEREAVDAFIEEELKYEDPYFEDDEEELDDDYDDFLWEEWEEEEFLFDEEDDFDEGEEWKELSDEFTLSSHGSIEMLDIYNDSRELAVGILQWIEYRNPKFLKGHCTDFVGNVLKVGAKIAGGYAFGFEREFLGGNIAYTKQALYCANDALTILQRDLKGTSLITKKQYLAFHEQLFELRNDIGIYIQELRHRFYHDI
ncbi:hypothetical protein [Fodinibius sediminis]|uniref:Uncharacterized protein n=1 Tax=Fodinibius sediminis TaxID=1214077 RepID=A0A521ALW2_9BACT|nr:hypothetical protein [Fodinibius sediminis]SMO35786.1 hypothetical protein SAMN06265218_101203 [Fodinibius sediminis]